MRQNNFGEKADLFKYNRCGIGLATSQPAPNVLTDVEHEIESTGEAVASVRYPHQQFALE